LFIKFLKLRQKKQTLLKFKKKPKKNADDLLSGKFLCDEKLKNNKNLKLKNSLFIYF